MPAFLSKRFAGLPAWAWVAILAGGATIGLILRARRNAADTAAQADQTDPNAPDASNDPYATDASGYPADTGYGANAVDTLGVGGYGYGNYPVTPIQPGINVTVTGGNNPPCDEKNRPKKAPRRGYQWGCRNGVWVMIPLARLPGHHHHPPHHPHHHRRHPHNNPLMHPLPAITGGGPPAARALHQPLGGLPRGQNPDVRTTWIPGNPSLLIPTS